MAPPAEPKEKADSPDSAPLSIATKDGHSESWEPLPKPTSFSPVHAAHRAADAPLEAELGCLCCWGATPYFKPYTKKPPSLQTEVTVKDHSPCSHCGHRKAERASSKPLVIPC